MEVGMVGKMRAAVHHTKNGDRNEMQNGGRNGMEHVCRNGNETGVGLGIALFGYTGNFYLLMIMNSLPP